MLTRGQDALFNRLGHGLPAAVDAKLLVQVDRVAPDRAVGDVQPLRYLQQAYGFDHHCQDLKLARGEGFREF